MSEVDQDYAVGDRVVVNWGRNKGIPGTVTGFTPGGALVVKWGTMSIGDGILCNDREMDDFYYVRAEDAERIARG